MNYIAEAQSVMEREGTGREHVPLQLHAGVQSRAQASDLQRIAVTHSRPARISSEQVCRDDDPPLVRIDSCQHRLGGIGFRSQAARKLDDLGNGSLVFEL